MTIRQGKVYRKTGETEVDIELNIDGKGNSYVETGIGYLNHMLTLFAKHGLMDLAVKAKGDVEVDSHHTVEDVGIVLGQCLALALKDKAGIKRYGTTFLPMDEAMATVSVDISGRPFLVFDAQFTTDKLGDFDTEMTEEFFRAFAFNAGITVHARILYGKNNHHMIEALFKALGRAISEAVQYDARIEGVMSTKGVIS